MRVTFAGVGEAFDETLPNTSIFVESGSSSVLLDCGFSVSQQLWQVSENPNALDVVYISHFHADHYFGLPALLVRFREEGRTKRLTIAGPPGIEPSVVHLVEMAYSNAMSKLGFEIFYMECDPGEDFKHEGFRFRFALSNHSMPCRAVRLDSGGKSLFYSGDGAPTAGTRELADGCDLIVHEAYAMNQSVPGHGTLESALGFARDSGASAAALVHVNRKVRKANKDAIIKRLAAEPSLNAFLPEPGDVFEI